MLRRGSIVYELTDADKPDKQEKSSNAGKQNFKDLILLYCYLVLMEMEHHAIY